MWHLCKWSPNSNLHSWPLNNEGARGTNPAHSQKSTYTFWLPKNYSWAAINTKIHGCPRPLYKMAQINPYNWPSVSVVGGTCECKTWEIPRANYYLLEKTCLQVDPCSLDLCCSRVNCTMTDCRGPTMTRPLLTPVCVQNTDQHRFQPFLKVVPQAPWF